MSHRNELTEVVEQLEDVVQAAVESRQLEGADLGRLLGFIAKVALVVEQVFQDVFAILMELKYLRPQDHSQLLELTRNLEMLYARSHYRDAEEICSRLFHLRQVFDSQVRPLLGRVADGRQWQQIFSLIEEREGRIIMLVQHTVRELTTMINDSVQVNFESVQHRAGEMAQTIRAELSELQSLKNQIMGISGREGLLELTLQERTTPSARQLYFHKGDIHMSRDHYSAGQVGAMGPNAHAHDMSFQQIWSQHGGSLDLPTLATELGTLRKAMRQDAETAEHDLAIGQVAAAETAATKGDGPSALKYLKAAGRWALDVATKIGVSVASEALKRSLGT